MLERELTSETGKNSIMKHLPGGWTMERVPDSGGGHRHAAGYDVWLVHGMIAIRTEVKIGNASLTASEKKKRDLCVKNGEPYVVLHFMNDRYWTLICGIFETSGTLAGCLRDLERHLVKPTTGAW